MDGLLFALYLGLYAMGKLMLNLLRSETIMFLGLQEARVFALGDMAIAVVWAILASAAGTRIPSRTVGMARRPQAWGGRASATALLVGVLYASSSWRIRWYSSRVISPFA